MGALVLGAGLVALLGWRAPSDASPSPVPAKHALAPVFVGPPGWHHAQGTSDGLGSWVLPDPNYAQNIVVQSKDGIGSLDALLSAEVAYIAGLPDRFGYAPTTDTTLCGDHPAKYLSYTYTSPTGLPVTAEVIIAVFGTTAYSARYRKSISQEADVAAERSLRTLCGRATSH